MANRTDMSQWRHFRTGRDTAANAAPSNRGQLGADADLPRRSAKHQAVRTRHGYPYTASIPKSKIQPRMFQRSSHRLAASSGRTHFTMPVRSAGAGDATEAAIAACRDPPAALPRHVREGEGTPRGNAEGDAQEIPEDDD